MNSLRRRGICFLLGTLGALGCLLQPLVVPSQTAAAEECPEKFQILPKGLKPLINTVAFVSEAILRSPKNQLTPAASPDLDEQKQLHDGQHDFDWQLGTWKIHMHRLQHPLTGSTSLDGARRHRDGAEDLGWARESGGNCGGRIVPGILSSCPCGFTIPQRASGL